MNTKLTERDELILQFGVASIFLAEEEEEEEEARAVVSLLDITDRKRTEKALRLEKENFRHSLDDSPLEVRIATIEGNTIYANQAILNIYGYDSLEELQKTPLKDRYTPESYAEALKRKNQRKHGDFSVTEYEISIVRKNGEIRHLQVFRKEVLWDGVKQFQVICNDITERKRAEEKIRLFSHAVEGSVDGIAITDMKGIITYANPAVEEIHGYNKGEMLGISIISFSTNPEMANEMMSIIIKTGTWSGEIEAIKKNKETFPVSLSLSTVRDEEGNPIAMMGAVRDITERKRAEEELIIAKEKAEENDRLKTAFLHNISHEIRTPMNAIVGFSSLLSEPDIDSSTRNSYIDAIINSSNHLLSIIIDIIDISNIEANIVKITKSGVNLNFVIKSLYEQFLLKANEKKITMISEPGLPDKESIILTDKTKLIQIISNLLNNALKFTRQGQVKFGYAVKDKLIEFFVSDTGLGIPEEQHQRIFDRFYQVENPVLKLYEGIGLGLAICNAYVELLGGEIRLSSTPGTGSTFYFTLPFEKPAGTTITTSSPMKETGFVFPEKKKILVAEDNDNNFKLIGYFLFGANVEIIRASNGNEAVEKCLSDQSIDLVLMDIRMPGMNGYTATDLIRLSKPDIPIIAQTAYADDRERAIECGCSGIISKPFDKKGLLKVIREFI
jgi:PAS domain S-box-containing protein